MSRPDWRTIHSGAAGTRDRQKGKGSGCSSVFVYIGISRLHAFISPITNIIILPAHSLLSVFRSYS